MTSRQTYIYGKDPIEINAGRRTVKLTVSNTGDRAVQIGSHYHFFEVNSALSFDRQQALGMHLNIPAGTSVRFEPGGSREVELCAYAGTGRLVGFSGLLNGSLASHPAKVEAVRKAVEQGFQGADGPARTWTDKSDVRAKATPQGKSAKKPAAKKPAAKKSAAKQPKATQPRAKKKKEAR